MNQRQKQVETICEEPRHEYQQENHAGINLGLFTPSPTDYDTEEAILANRLIKKKKKPKRNRFFKEYAPRYGYKYLCTEDDDYKYYQTLGLKLIHRGLFRQYNYGLPLKELEA